MFQPFSSQKLQQSNKLSGLDHLRALAITFVFLFHYRSFGHPDWEEKIGSFGWTGVDLFFVLSGFLISGQIFSSFAKGEAISLRVFFIKRVFRIIPAYLLVLGLYAVFPLLRERDPIGPIWKYLTFSLNCGLDLSKTGTFTHAWSLCIEEQFYLILPFILLFGRFIKADKKGLLLCLFLFLAGLIIRAVIWQKLAHPGDSWKFSTEWHKDIYYPTYTRLDGLLTGVSLAAFYHFYLRVKNQIDHSGNTLLLIGVFLLVIAFFVCAEPSTFLASVFGFPLVSIAYGLITAGAISPSSVMFRLSSKLTSGLAALSYSIYLVHKMMIHVSQNLFEQAGVAKDSNTMLLICIITTVLGALILRYSIERPFLRLRKRTLKAIGKAGAK